MTHMSMAEHIESAVNRLAPKFSSNHGPITALHRLSGGASQEIWAFERSGESGAPEKYILRRAPGGQGPDESAHTLPLEAEAQLLRAVGQSPLKVPKVRYICAPEDGLGSAYIMDFVEGQTIARKIQRDEAYTKTRTRFASDCGVALAHIHQTPLPILPDNLPRSGGADQLARYKQIYRDLGIARPVFELAFAHLEKTCPEAGDHVLVHGDFRLGNLMVDESGLACVLDWELAHLGDPCEDIGWICVNSWRFGAAQNRVAGISSLDDFLAAYRSAGGDNITPNQIDWWEALGSLKWGIMCMIMYDAYQSGKDRSVERAAIGRRVSETEIDLINLMEKA